MGLASDGGLLVPETSPMCAQNSHWRDLNFVELAQELIPKFIDDMIRKLWLDRGISFFSHADVSLAGS